MLIRPLALDPGCESEEVSGQAVRPGACWRFRGGQNYTLQVCLCFFEHIKVVQLIPVPNFNRSECPQFELKFKPPWQWHYRAALEIYWAPLTLWVPTIVAGTHT